jgi:nucleoside-diphosphate-sugar epimerase
MELSKYYAGKKVLVTGGAGFVGSHLVDRLIALGAEVVVVDNLITGKKENLTPALSSGKAQLIEADASKPVGNYLPKEITLDIIIHAASPASPVDYNNHPVETYLVNGMGTHYLAEYAAARSIPFLFTSTSEAYGDPEVHPQVESYWGHVNPVGIRSCYDESKRFGEMAVSTWNRTHGLDGRIVRIFNTYGPRMAIGDGRVIPNFINQALKNEAVTIYGDGSQTRSFCYVSDLVEFLVRAAVLPEARHQVINIGNTDEWSVADFAGKVIEMTDSRSTVEHRELPSDDPSRRKPDLTKAKDLLGYEAEVSLNEGLTKTIAWFRDQATVALADH